MRGQMATENQTRELVEKAQAGDAQAFDNLVERYKLALKRPRLTRGSSTSAGAWTT